jgi:hypothetical protein
MQMTLNNKAIASYNKAFNQGIVSDTIKEIVETLYNQEVVSYCTSEGCITFDYADLTW